MQPVIAGEVRLRVRPRHLEGGRRLDGAPFLRSHDREQILDPDHPRASNLRDRAFVDLDRHRARHLRADHASMQHAGQPEVVDEIEGTEHLAGQIAAAERFSDDLEPVRRLQRHHYVDGERVRGLAVPAHLAFEVASADELRVGNAPRGVGDRMHHAVRHRELIGRQAQRVGGALDQEMARQCRGAAQHHTAVRDPDGGAGPAHVEGAAAIAHDDAHSLERDVDLLGHHLGDRGAEPLPAVDLAVIGQHRAVRLDGDVGGKLVAGERRPGRRADRGGLRRLHLGKARCRCQRDHQGAARSQKSPAVERERFDLAVGVDLVHDLVHDTGSPGYHGTARRELGWGAFSAGGATPPPHSHARPCAGQPTPCFYAAEKERRGWPGQARP